jgi:TolA-binding protein
MADTQVTPFNERFADIMSGLLFDVLKAAGVNWQPSKAYERIRETGRRMALTIEFHAERKAIDVAKKLQSEVVKAFKSMEEEIDKLNKRIEELEKNADSTRRAD